MSLFKKIKKGVRLRENKKEIGQSETEAQEKEIKIEEEKWFEAEGELALDVYQTDEEIVIEAPIAGVKPEDIEITIEQDTISIKGKREKSREEERKNYLIKECYWGSFSREIILPVEIDGSRAKASIKEGILKIRIPKLEREKKRKISIKEE